MYVYIEGFLIKPGHLCQCVCYLSQLICSFFDSNTQTAIYKRSLLRSFLIFSAIISYMCSLFPIAPSSFLTYRIISEIIMGFRKL